MGPDVILHGKAYSTLDVKALKRVSLFELHDAALAEVENDLALLVAETIGAAEFLHGPAPATGEAEEGICNATGVFSSIRARPGRMMALIGRARNALDRINNG